MGIKIDLEAVEKICNRLIADKGERVLRSAEDGDAWRDRMFFSDALFAAATMSLARSR